MSVELPADITRRVTIAAAGPLHLNRENCAVREHVSSQHDPSDESILTWYFIAGALRAVSIVAADGEDRLLAFLHRRHACRHQIRSASVPTLHFNLYGVRTKECFLCEYLAMVGPICSLDSSIRFFIVQVTQTVQSKLTTLCLVTAKAGTGNSLRHHGEYQRADSSLQNNSTDIPSLDDFAQSKLEGER